MGAIDVDERIDAGQPLALGRGGHLANGLAERCGEHLGMLLGHLRHGVGIHTVGAAGHIVGGLHDEAILHAVLEDVALGFRLAAAYQRDLGLGGGLEESVLHILGDGVIDAATGADLLLVVHGVEEICGRVGQAVQLVAVHHLAAHVVDGAVAALKGVVAVAHGVVAQEVRLGLRTGQHLRRVPHGGCPRAVVGREG